MALLHPLKNSLVLRLFPVLVFLLLIAAWGCKPEKAIEGNGLLPEAPADQTSAAAPVKEPFDQPLGEAAFARTVFQTTGPSKVAITVRDVIVGPHAEAPLTAGGPVLIDVNSGSGTATAGDKTLELNLDGVVSFPAGVAIALKNTSDTPLVLRLYTLEGK